MADEEDFMSDGNEDFDINALPTTSRGSDRRRGRDRIGGGSPRRPRAGPREGGGGECESVADLVLGLLKVCRLLIFLKICFCFCFCFGMGAGWCELAMVDHSSQVVAIKILSDVQFSVGLNRRRKCSHTQLSVYPPSRPARLPNSPIPHEKKKNRSSWWILPRGCPPSSAASTLSLTVSCPPR